MDHALVEEKTSCLRCLTALAYSAKEDFGPYMSPGLLPLIFFLLSDPSLLLMATFILISLPYLPPHLLLFSSLPLVKLFESIDFLLRFIVPDVRKAAIDVRHDLLYPCFDLTMAHDLT